MPKKTLDMRGGQARIARLIPFYPWAFIHMLFYRILAPYSILYGVILLYSFAYPVPHLAIKASTLIFWVLITPQLFETVRGLTMSWSRGLVFGRLNKEYSSLMKKRYGKNSLQAYRSIPYLVIALWIAGFLLMVVFG